MTDPAWMTPDEAAEVLKMRPDRLRRLAQRGDIPHHKDGKFLRFTSEDVDAYLASTYIPAIDMRPVKTRRRTA